MGVPVIPVVSLVVGVGSAIVGVSAARSQAKAEQEALYQQEVEMNKIAAAEASDAARAADKAAAAAIAGMEAIGGYGSYNDKRLQLEIAGYKGLDLARIESNRARQAAQLFAARRAAGHAANNALFTGLGQIAGSVSNYFGDMEILDASKAKSDFDLHNVQHLDTDHR